MAIESKAIDHIRNILKQFGNKYFTEDGALKRSTIIEDLDNYDKDLMAAILNDNLLHETYTFKIEDVEIFEINKFVDMLRYKEYWEDSFTKYNNKIGLTIGDRYIDDSSDVVLDFPYKDCILKAGMSKEDVERSGDADEPFLNETIAKPEIDELLEPKIFVNATKYDKDGKSKASFISTDDNLIIKGNNLIALYSLKEKYAGKIDTIYIDPPFHTNKDTFKYNDAFSRSAWLTFILNRLEIAKELLSDCGSIFVHIDWHESAYLKVLLDSVFGEDHLINEIIWHYGSGGSYKNQFARKHDTIYWYSKTSEYKYYPNNSMVGTKRGPNKKNNMKRNVDENGKVFYSIKSAGKLYKYYEDELVTPDDVWNLSILQQKDPERKNFNSQKPERLLARIIGATTEENDLILDFFGGSGTTMATALKMHRKFISIEQIDNQIKIEKDRIRDVIAGKKSGISKDVNWQGGGSFIYAELMEKNQGYLKDIQNAKDIDDLMSVYGRIKQNGDIDFRVDLDKFESSLKAGELPSFSDRKKELIKIIDKNQLYYNYSNIDDADVKDLLSDSDYKFNKSFYSSNEVGKE